jgi:plasmid stability protein
MPNVLVRDLADDVLRELKAAAKANGRSLQAEIHAVLRNASMRRRSETRRLSARWLKRLRGTRHSDSAGLIRADRDRR